GFCFAPRFHSSMRFAGPTRRELGVPTTFNFLGPLANPARVRRQVVGVSDPTMAERMLASLDELTTTTVSDVFELVDGDVRHSVIDPGELGIARVDMSALVGGDPTHNA